MNPDLLQQMNLDASQFFYFFFNLRAATWPWCLEFYLRLRTYGIHLSASSYSGLHCIFSAWLWTATTPTNNYTMSGKARYQEYLEKKREGERQKKGQKQRPRGNLKDLSHILFPFSFLSCPVFGLHFKDDEWHSSGRLLISSMLGRGLDRDYTELQCYCGGCVTPSINYMCLEYHLQGARSWTTHGLREQ